MLRFLFIFYALVSIVAFFLYGRDKRKAKRGKWRTSEAFLLSLGFFGGSVGALLGMNCFRHKTKHLYFWLINLLGLAWQLALVIFLYRNGYSL